MISCDKYVCSDILGVGCSSWVFKTQAKDKKSLNALKIINLNDNPGFNQLCFENEVQILQFLSHSNIIKLDDYAIDVPCEINSHEQKVLKVNYIALELLQEGDLFSFLKTGAFCEETSRYFFHQIIDGLEYLHKNGISHRDIKPENLMFDDNYTLKIVDFGFATEQNTGNSKVGTFEYMVPEIFNNQKYDFKQADLFAAAVVLFNIISAHPPFHTASLDDKLYQLLASGSSKSFWKIHNKAMKDQNYFSVEFQELINTMLAYDPRQRPSIEQIKESKWYNGPLPEYEDILVEMALRKKYIEYLSSQPDDLLGTNS